MANGEGALVAQQREAAQIPYENIAVNQRSAAMFLNTFQAAANIGNQRRRLEEQMLKMEMDSKFKEQNYELNVARLLTSSALQTAEHNRKMEAMQNQLDMGTQRINLAQSIQDWKEAKDKDAMEQITGLASDLGRINLAPNDPNKPSAIWDAVAKNPRAAKMASGLVKDAFNNYNLAARATKSKLDSDVNDFYKDAKAALGPIAGSGTVPNLGPIYNIEGWKEQWVDKSGKPIPEPAEGETPPEGAHKSGKVFMPFPTSDPNRPGYVTLPAQKLIDLRKKLDAINERRRTLPNQVTNEYTQAQSTGVPDETVTVRTIEERNSLQPGTRYIGPDGKPHIRGND